MENNKNTIRSDEDEKRDRNNEPAGWVDITDHEAPAQAMPSPSLDEVLDGYIFPTPYLDEEERLREERARAASQQNPEGFSEYQILGSDDSGELEDEDEDSKINNMFRPTLTDNLQRPRTLADEIQQASENETVLDAELNARQERIWAYYSGSTYREEKIQAYRNQGLSPKGAASQEDVMFRARVLPVFGGRETPGNPEHAAFLQEFPLGTLEDSLELYRPFPRDAEEEEELEPLIPKETEDKVWEAWCVSLGLTSEQIADLFKDFPDSEDPEADGRFIEKWLGWLEELTALGLSEAEATEKLKELCDWAIDKHDPKPDEASWAPPPPNSFVWNNAMIQQHPSILAFRTSEATLD